MAIHIGEGVNYYFHAALHKRASYLPRMLTGNIGRHGTGGCTWAGNYKGAVFHASPWSGPGVGNYVAENPFSPVLDENVWITKQHLRKLSDEEWIQGSGTIFGRRPLRIGGSFQPKMVPDPDL